MGNREQMEKEKRKKRIMVGIPASRTMFSRCDNLVYRFYCQLKILQSVRDARGSFEHHSTTPREVLIRLIRTASTEWEKKSEFLRKISCNQEKINKYSTNYALGQDWKKRPPEYPQVHTRVTFLRSLANMIQPKEYPKEVHSALAWEFSRSIPRKSYE